MSISLHYCISLDISTTVSDSKAKANLLKKEGIKEFLQVRKKLYISCFKTVSSCLDKAETDNSYGICFSISHLSLSKRKKWTLKGVRTCMTHLLFEMILRHNKSVTVTLSWVGGDKIFLFSFGEDFGLKKKKVWQTTVFVKY